MKPDNQISLANFFVYNSKFGLKEGQESKKIFYYYPAEEKIERQIRQVGLCAGIVGFTLSFKPTKPCEFVHTEKIRMIFHQADEDFMMVMSLNVPYSSSDKVYQDDQVSDHIYMSVLRQIYNNYKLFHGTFEHGLSINGADKLKQRIRTYFDNLIENKLNVQDCDLMNTFSGLQFMSLDRGMYLKIQCLLNLLEEKVPLVTRTVVMHNDQVIWSGLEQEEIASIYNYLRELVLKNANSASTQAQPALMAKFLIDESIRSKLNESAGTSSSVLPGKQQATSEDYFELDKVYLGKPLQQYYLVPYNFAKLTFFIFIRISEEFKLSLLSQIDQVLGAHMLALLHDISEQQLRRNFINQDDKEIRYIYFNRLNLAQKSTIANTKEIPKYIINLIAQLSKDLEACQPSGEIFVKSGKDYWIACKKSDLREVYVIVSQKNANLTFIDEEVKQLCSTQFSNIFFME